MPPHFVLLAAKPIQFPLLRPSVLGWTQILLQGAMHQAVEKTDTERVRAIFEAAFREYGLPEAIRTDNGAPFASSALSGLSRLSVW